MKPSQLSLFLSHLKMGFLGFRETPSLLERVEKFWNLDQKQNGDSYPLRRGDKALLLISKQKKWSALIGLLLPTLLFIGAMYLILNRIPIRISISSTTFLLASTLQALLIGIWIFELLKKLASEVAANNSNLKEQRYILMSFLVAFTVETTGLALIFCLLSSIIYALLHSKTDLLIRKHRVLSFGWESIFLLLPLAGLFGFFPSWSFLVFWQEAFFLKGEYLSPSTFANTAVLAFATPFPVLSWALFLSAGLGAIGMLSVLVSYLGFLFVQSSKHASNLFKNAPHTKWAIEQGFYGGLAYIFLRLIFEWPVYLNWGIIPLLFVLLGVYLRFRNWSYIGVYFIGIFFVLLRSLYDKWGGGINL